MSNSDNRTLIEKLDHVEALTGMVASETDRTYYSDAREVFAALRARLAASPDPIAELEELGARLDFKLKPDLVCWTLVDDLGRTTLVEEMVYPFTVDSARTAARCLLARIRGAK